LIFGLGENGRAAFRKAQTWLEGNITSSSRLKAELNVPPAPAPAPIHTPLVLINCIVTFVINNIQSYLVERELFRWDFCLSGTLSFAFFILSPCKKTMVKRETALSGTVRLFFLASRLTRYDCDINFRIKIYNNTDVQPK
jgi:hypothetical protein